MALPCIMVIFGAAGDLTKRLVVPALYNLVTAKRLPEGFRLIGVDLILKPDEEWRRDLMQMMNEFVSQGGEFEANHIDQTAWRWLTSLMSYLQDDLIDGGCYRRLGAPLASIAKTDATGGQSTVLSGGRRPLLRHRRRSAGRRGPGQKRGRRLAPGSHRKALRPRSGLGAP